MIYLRSIILEYVTIINLVPNKLLILHASKIWFKSNNNGSSFLFKTSTCSNIGGFDPFSNLVIMNEVAVNWSRYFPREELAVKTVVVNISHKTHPYLQEDECANLLLLVFHNIWRSKITDCLADSIRAMFGSFYVSSPTLYQ